MLHYERGSVQSFDFIKEILQTAAKEPAGVESVIAMVKSFFDVVCRVLFFQLTPT